MKTSTIELNIRPLTRNGKKLNDAQLIDATLDTIKEYEDKHHEAFPGIKPKFIAWLKQTKKKLQDGENIVDIKRQTVTRLIPDYEEVCKNTAIANQRLKNKEDYI